MFYIPRDNVAVIDVAVLATNEIKRNTKGEFPHQAIDAITVQGRDITEQISKYNIWNTNESNLKKVLTHHLAVPEELIQIHSSVELTRMTFKYQTKHRLGNLFTRPN